MSEAGRPELTHLALAVLDLDHSLRFYEEYCGLRVIHRREEKDRVRVAWVADSQAGGEGFVLVLAEGASKGEPLGPFAHLGFSVGSRDEVDEVAERAREDGILHLEPVDAGPVVGYLCEIRDPDENLVELSHGQELGRRHRPG